ncbi:leucine-rich repeat-containing protein 36-like [Hypomesus transpacificus]|uniref:leucine-rich repeat-containing protein 36-like n=1 Tax=Hypomesus transpacificus TaxID=137520 RepID=UPI001F0805A4|nr:leucine-rich repeat-containing protein 36-like [Hypomesus transpacificus]XP_046906897.1 leucine-rich repeat-containing protein 36-like [Hypomesus transpacificus]
MKMKSGSVEDEYRPLPSPPRSSLRSGRPPSRARDQGRVTFAQDSFSNTFKLDPEKPVTSRLESNQAEPKQSPISASDQAPLLKESVQGREAWDYEYIPAHWICPAPSLTTPLQSLVSVTNTDIDLDTRTKRLLELTSDLYVATHQSDHIIPLQRSSEGVPRWRSPTRRSVSMDRLLDHLSPRLQRAWKRGGSPERQPMDHGRRSSSSPRPDSTSKNVLSSFLSVPSETLLQAKSTYQTISTTQSSRLGSIDCPVPRIPSPRLGISELSSTLKGFLDLVDQHWSGKRSLHLNPTFLGQAYDILSSSISSASLAGSSPNKTEGLRDEKIRGEEETESNNNIPLHCSELGHLKRKLAQTEQQLASFKKRLVSALKENYNLRLRNLKQDPSSPVNSEKQWTSCFQRQVKALREQESYLRQLEQTVVLMQDNHRSLVTNNVSILGQLNGRTTEEAAKESLATQSWLPEQAIKSN